MTPIIRKFVLKLLSKDRGSGITSLPGSQHRMIQESIITDTLLKKGVKPESITSEGMLQSILNGIKKEEAMIARSKAEAQKNLATVMDLKGRKIRPGAQIMGGEEVIETEAEIAKRLNKGNKEGIERIKEKQIDWDEVSQIDPDDFASGGRAGFAAGGIFNAARRAFLKAMGSGAAGIAGAKAGIFGLGKKAPIKKVDDIEVSIRSDTDLTDVWDEGRNIAETNTFVDLIPLTKNGEKILKKWKVDPSKSLNTEDALVILDDVKTKKQGGIRLAKESEVEEDLLVDPIYGNPYFQDEFVEEILEIARPLKKKVDKKATGGRAGFAGGGMGRRAFLKLMAALGATGVAAKSGLVTLLGKGKGKQVAKELTQVPIKQINEMPTWFKPLVNRVIKEGEEMKVTEYDRLITHKTKLPNSKTDVYVNQDLNTGDVWVDIGAEKHGFPDGKFGQPVRLEYKASEVIEPPFIKDGKVVGKQKGVKTKEEFNVEEAEFTGGHPENVKFEETSIQKYGEHETDFSEIEEFATGLKKGKGGSGHMADGGRVSRWMGGGLSKGKRTLSDLLKMMAKDSSHGRSPSEMLQMINPKQFNQMLDRPEGIPSIAKEMIEKYTKEMKGDRVNMIQDLIATGRRIKKVDDDLVNYKIKIVEDMVSKGVDRGTAKEMAETLAEMVQQGARKKATPKITDQGLLELENIGKNLATKDRKLNASGGLAHMLGE